MRLRNIPGAKDAILDCEWVIDEPERFKGKWNEVFGYGKTSSGEKFCGN